MENCLDKEIALRWCILHNPSPKRCEVLLADLSQCWARHLL